MTRNGQPPRQEETLDYGVLLGASETEPVVPTLRYEWRVFATSYTDPTSPTFGKKLESYLNAYPKCTRKSAYRQVFQLLKRPEVKAEIARLRIQNVAATGLTAQQYLATCFAQAQMLLKRGLPGDAGAAAALMKLVGQANGFLVHRTEDMTPPERRQLTGDHLFREVVEAADRWRRLREPPPVAVIAPGPPPPDYEAPPGRCWHCYGKRKATNEFHFSGHPTCDECDYRLNDERHARANQEQLEAEVAAMKAARAAFLAEPDTDILRPDLLRAPLDSPEPPP